MIHIVFQLHDIAALKKSFELDPSMQGDILLIADDFAVGPLQNTGSAEGMDMRKQWWTEILAGGDYKDLTSQDTPADHATVQTLIARLNENPSEVIWIWAAQNNHDVCGYYWLISQLTEFQGRIFILYLNNLPFINEKGNIFYPTNLFDIPAKEFVKAKKLARPVTLSELETDPDEWQKLIAEQKGVRILEGGKKLSQYDYDFYDESLIKYITGDWIRASKLIHQFLSKAKYTTGDAYLLWRLKQIIVSGLLETQGEIRNMKDFEVRQAATGLTIEN
jgi:hypothetical protein